MEFVCFTTLQEALDHRRRGGRGGWVFGLDCGKGYWFRPGITASKVMLHHGLRGLNGTLH